MDANPIIVDIQVDIDDLSQSLISAGLQQMLYGFLVVDTQGNYLGIGNAQNLLAAKQFTENGSFRLSINTSVREIQSQSFLESFLTLLEEIDIPPSRLQLEITERLFIETNQQVLDKLIQLREMGVRIAIDDFGIGTTSLRLLHMLPVDIMKIDRSFIANSDNDPRAEALVRAIIDMGHALDLEIVAEGVETWEQAHRLREVGCDFLQGYLFCQPLPIAEFKTWLLEHNPERIIEADLHSY